MESARRLASRFFLFCALAVATSWRVALAVDIDTIVEAKQAVVSVEEIPFAAARALKSVLKIPPGVSERFDPELRLDNRRLLAGKQDCLWKDGECALTDEKAIELLSSASSDTAKLALKSRQCRVVKCENECAELGCDWVDGECSFGNSVGPDALSNCIGDAAKLGNAPAIQAACKAGFNSTSTCDADENCTWDEDEGACGFDPRKVVIGSIQSESVEDPQFRDTLEPFFMCGSVEEGDCNDQCEWDVDSESCTTNLIKLFGVVSKRNPAPVCQLLGAVFLSGCSGASTARCASNPNCEVDEGGDCNPTEEFLLDALLANDEDVRKKYRAASKRCNTAFTCKIVSDRRYKC